MWFYNILLLCGAVWACGNNKPASSKQLYSDTVISLNDSAVALMQAVYANADSTARDSILNQALLYLDKATEIDSLYVTAYQTKIQIFRILNLNQRAIAVIQQLLKINPTPETYFSLGVTYEKIEDTLSAAEYYQKAIVAYDELLKESQDSMPLLINRYFALLFIQNKDETIAQMNKALKYSSDTTWMRYKALFEEFDRNEFVKHF